MQTDRPVRLSWRQACAYLHICKSTFYKLIREGKLVKYAAKQGAGFVLKEDCDKLLEEKKWRKK